MPPVKYWELIADQLHAEGWSYGIAEPLWRSLKAASGHWLKRCLWLATTNDTRNIDAYIRWNRSNRRRQAELPKSGWRDTSS